MNAIEKHMIINTVIKQWPQTMHVFNRFNVDICCGSGDTIELGSKKSSVDVEDVLQELNKVIKK